MTGCLQIPSTALDTISIRVFPSQSAWQRYRLPTEAAVRDMLKERPLLRCVQLRMVDTYDAWVEQTSAFIDRTRLTLEEQWATMQQLLLVERVVRVSRDSIEFGPSMDRPGC